MDFGPCICTFHGYLFQWNVILYIFASGNIISYFQMKILYIYTYHQSGAEEVVDMRGG